jgi:GTP-binding protein
MLRQSGQFRDAQLQGERILDSNDLERERGITILSKNIALPYRDVKINIIDTPGHADFGGEVERVVGMADGALLLLDAAEGVMPQTRFVLSKALEAGLKPIVVINKIDRPDARCDEVVDEALELLTTLGGDHFLDQFSFVFASAKEGYATLDHAVRTEDMTCLLDKVVDEIPGPDIDESGDLQMLVTTLDWSEYVGRIAVGCIQAGEIRVGQSIALCQADGVVTQCRVGGLHVFENLGRQEVESASAGEVVAITGLDNVEIGDTVCAAGSPAALDRVSVDEPTLEMLFTINSSPLVGREGKYVTSRQLKERLYKELERNVALRVRPSELGDGFCVSGRGVLHLSVLIENMRREGFELSVGKPTVITRKSESGQTEEPFETLVVEVPTDRFGSVMELVGERRGLLDVMESRGDYTMATFQIPSRGLIGLRTRMLNATQGTAVMNHRFSKYGVVDGEIPRRPQGVLISKVGGKTLAFSLDGLQQRSELFVNPGDEVYEGMIVGENSRDNDMDVNPTRGKKLTNMRAAGNDDNILLKPARIMSLEAALEYIEEGELVEITPETIRLRKILLKESDRRREARKAKS